MIWLTKAVRLSLQRLPCVGKSRIDFLKDFVSGYSGFLIRRETRHREIDQVSVEEQIVTNLRDLPPEQRGEVLDFVEFLKHRRQQEKEPRPFGLCAGEFEVPDDFDAPLPESVLQTFEQ